MGNDKLTKKQQQQQQQQQKGELLKLLNECDDLDKTVDIDDKGSMMSLLIKLLSEYIILKNSTKIPEMKNDGVLKEGGCEGGAGARMGEGGAAEEGWNEHISMDTKSKLKVLSSRVRKNEDYSDFIHQRSVKGKIIVVSPNNPDKNLETLIKDPSDLKDETYLEQMIRLIKLYYDVDIKKSDVINCHPTKQPGCGIIVFGNRNIGSAFAKLSQAIKTGGVKRVVSEDRSNVEGGSEKGETEEVSGGSKMGVAQGESQMGAAEGDLEGAKRTQDKGEKSKGKTPILRPNFWLTFQMTTRRSALIKKLKELKKNNKIYKFNSDENGEISFTRQKDGRKQRLTMDWLDENSKTYTVEELVKLF